MTTFYVPQSQPDDLGRGDSGYAPPSGGVWAATGGRETAENSTAPRLLVDVGAVQLRFALQWPDRLDLVTTLRCADCESLEAATLQVLRQLFPTDPLSQVRHAVFAVAYPVTGDEVALTNHPWRFSVNAMRRNLRLQTLLVVNDFAAVAMALVDLQPEDSVDVGGAQINPRQVRAVMGAGTGLGMAGLVPFEERHVVLSTEGGHVPFAPDNALEALAVEQARRRYGHASLERLLSASGLEMLHDLCATLVAQPGALDNLRTRAPHLAGEAPLRLVESGLSAPEIAALALQRRPDEAAWHSLSMFCAMLGSVTGNLALTLGSLGGVYLAGGMLPHWGDFLQKSDFRRRFLEKGRFRRYLEPIATRVIVAPQVVFRGLSAVLADHLRQTHGPARMLLDVREAYPRLSVAEKKVAGDLLSAPRMWLQDPIAQIAQRCQVSAPTVMRFCRSLGFKGLSEFKLRLGAGLASSTEAPPAEASAEDPVGERLDKHFDRQCATLLALRDGTPARQLARVTQALTAARQVQVLAGPSRLWLAALARDGLSVATAAGVGLHATGAAQAAALDRLQAGDAVLCLGPWSDGLGEEGAWLVQAVRQALAAAAQRGVIFLALGTGAEMPPWLPAWPPEQWAQLAVSEGADSETDWCLLAWLRVVLDDVRLIGG